MPMSNKLNIALVCNPNRSVVVSACAGSGKTWLLVARLVRILLTGESPRAILALTFTRKAAQEMRDRLYSLLHEWTQQSDQDLIRSLEERGLSTQEAKQQLQRARTLYEHLLANPHAVVIDTFHGWFGTLLSGAPVSMGAQQGFSLREDAKRLQAECLEDWWSSLPKEIEAHYEVLLEHLGSHQTNQFLLGPSSLLRQKGAWVFFEKACKAQGQNPLEVLKAFFKDHQRPNLLLEALGNAHALEELKKILDGLHNGGKKDQNLVPDLELAITHLANNDLTSATSAIVPVFMTQNELPSYRKDNDGVSKTILAYLHAQQQDAEAFVQIRQHWGRVCEQHIEWRAQQDAIVLNQAWFAVSAAIFKHTQRAKERLRVRDFDDLELGVAQMISDPRIAAYLQARLDARYNHILIDEFQDTNPLQWQILKSWLEAYGEDADRPKVFIVGDPKQSIYRFRRADPRLFTAATHFLQKHYDAALEEQNTTRRNAPKIVEAVNVIFAADRIPLSYPFKEQNTLWASPPLPEPAVYQNGEAYRLDLIPYEEPSDILRSGNALEAALVDPHETPAKKQRAQEGQRIARLIQHVMQTRRVLDEELDTKEAKQKRTLWRLARPGDFLLLVKRRAYLPEYEKALREAGLLFDSPRLGGLLETLEVDDLIALLTILVTPGNDLALAQVLRSPLFSLDEAQMQTLAELVQSNQGYRNWWEALTHAEDHPHQARFHVITQLLQQWIGLAKHLPVHDLLDHVYFSGDVRLQYASHCHESDRDQVLANLDAFLELALNLDGGRYPSLGRFITQLNRMRRGDEDETPDEGEMSADVSEGLEDLESDHEPSDDLQEAHDQRTQRVRLMTIHGAKGLEASFVILLDSNNTAVPHFSHGVLLDWDPDQASPGHLSMFTKLSLGKGREDLKQQEKEIALKENWNLLYVAITRAKQGFWMSGVESSQNREDAGVMKDSWYARARSAELALFTELDHPAKTVMQSPAHIPSLAPTPETQFELRDLVLSWRGTEPIQDEESTISPERQQALDEGVWFHGVLQRISPQQYRPVSKNIPEPHAVASAFMISLADAERALQRALTVYQDPELQIYFDPTQYQEAWNELDLMTVDGKSMRIDRLVELSDSLVILDYKLSIPKPNDSLYQKYSEQLSQYRNELQRIYPHRVIKAILIDAQGQSLPLIH